MRTTTKSLKDSISLYLCLCICLIAISATASNSTSYSSPIIDDDDPAGNVSISMVTVGSFPDYGISIPFNITVENQGVADIYDVIVTNTIPEGYTFDPSGTSWIVDGTNPNVYTNTIAGPIGPSTTDLITINLVPIAAADSTDWINTVEITEFRDGPGGTVCADGDLSDNTAMAAVALYDLALRKELITPAPYSYGQLLTFRTYVMNQGNTPATDIRIIDFIPEGYDYDAATNAANGWTGMATPIAVLPGQLNSNEETFIDIQLTLTMEMFDGMAWNNYTTIISARDNNAVNRTGFDADSNLGSNSISENSVLPGDADDNNMNGGGLNAGEDEDDHDPAAPIIFDLALEKVQLTALPSFSYDEETTFRNRIYNQGNQTVTNIEIVDYIPCGFEFIGANNPGWTYNSVSRIAHYTITTVLAPSTTDFVDIKLNVVQCYENQETAWSNFAEIASATDMSGLPFVDIDSVMDSIMTNDQGAEHGTITDNQLDGGGPKAGEDEDDHDIKKIEVVDLAIKKRILEPGPFNMGDTITFVNTVFNQGNIVLDSIRIRDYKRSGYIFHADINPTWTLNPSGNPEGLIPTMLFPEDSINYELKLTLTPANAVTDYYNFAEIILAQDTTNSFTRNRFDDADSFVGSHFFPGSSEPNVVPDSSDDNNIFGDGFDGEDSDDNDVAAPIFYDLALTKSLVDPGVALEYGTVLSYTITVTNEGTVEANGVRVTDYLACGLGFDMANNTGWNIDPVTDYVYYDIPTTITPGGTIDLTINLTLQECDSSDSESFTNIAEISVDDGDDRDSEPDDDPNDDPVEDDIDDQPLPIYDLSLAKTISSTASTYGVGDPITFTIEVTNEGGESVQNVKVVDYLPCGFGFAAADNMGWSLNATTGFLEYNNNALLAPGGTFSTELTLTIQACTVVSDDNYLNGAEISEAQDIDGDMILDIDSTPDETQGNEEDQEDDYDEVGIDIYDLSLSKSLTTPVTSFAYGQNISYDITVTNEGTMLASGIQITDYIPCGLAYDAANNSLVWAVDPVTGFATYTIPTDIVSGASVTVTIVLTLEECTQDDAGKYNNKAEISIDNGDDDDSDPDNDPENDPPGEDDNDDEPLPIYDLSLTKEIAVAADYSVGDMITFEITLANEGSETVQNIKVVDYLPCGYGFVPNNGWSLNVVTGFLENTYASPLTQGESTTLDLELTIESCDQGGADNYLNGAEIAEMQDLDDMVVSDVDSSPDEIQGNEVPNEDDYDEAGIDIYDLSLSKTRTNTNELVAYGSTLVYDIEVTNEGSLPATGIQVTDYIPCGLVYNASDNTANWTIDNTTGYASYIIPQTILPGESAVVEIILTIEPCASPSTDAYNNKAEITLDDGDDDDSDPDDDPENDPPGEDDNDDEPEAIYDLAVTKTVQGDPNSFSTGDVVVFEIEVTNEGNRTAQNVNVIDYVPCGFSTDAQVNTGWSSIVGSDNITYQIASMAPGEIVTLEVSFLIVACDTYADENYGNETEITSFQDENGDEGSDIDSTPDDIPGDPESEDDNDTAILMITGTLGGDVWKDLDFDGIHDTNEPSISDMTVNLYDCDGNFIRSTTTGQTGFYVFLNLPSDDYQVQFDLESLDEPCVFTEPDMGGDDARDSDAGLDGFAPCTEVEVGSENYTIDAGLIESLGTIGDYVFTDLDADGVQDAGESGIENMTVNLYSEGGLLIASTMTDSQGAYSFDDVSGGYYYVEFDAEDILLPTLVDATNDTQDSDITEDNGPNTTDVFYLAPGENNTDIDGGFYECATICGYTWVDLVNENDLRDPTENGINGMNVKIFRIENGVSTEYDRTYTGHKPNTPSDDGYFNFCVPPGRYYVEFVLPPLGLVQVLPLSGPQNINSDVNNYYGVGTTSAFNIGNGGEKCDIGAGYTLMSEVGNSVWLDQNLNGQREEYEEAVEGVIVQAYDLNNVMVAEAVTDENGLYNIDYLQKKDYYLKFTAEEGMTFTQALVGGDDELDSDVDHSFGPNTTRAFLGAPGSANKNMDAGIVLSVLPVEWGSIQAENKGDLNLVSWSTYSEINNHKFLIQKSQTGNGNFITIGEVEALEANSTTLRSYSFQDRDLRWSQYYYRIVQLDVDGRKSFSDIVALEISKEGFLVYPNPVDGDLKITSTSFQSLDNVAINIYDQVGKLILETYFVLQGNSEVTIPVSQLTSGIYSIEVMDNGSTLHTQRFIKQ